MRAIIKNILMLPVICSFIVAALCPVLISGESNRSELLEEVKSGDALGSIPYAVHGSGDKTVLFLHGFMDAGNVWESVIQEMDSREYRFITLDLPFMGELSENQGEVSLPALTEAVIGVIDELKEPVVLVGQSMGAQIAELAAHSRPDRIEGMVFIAPVPLEGLPVPEEFIATMRALANDALMQREFRRQVFPDLDEAELKKLVENGVRITPHNIVALIAAWSGGDSAGASPGPNGIPVLIVGGANDTVCTPEVLESLVVPRFEMGKMVLLPHAGHWPHIDYPSEVAREIEKFVESIERE